MRFRTLHLLVVLALTVGAWGAQLRQVGIIDIPGQPGFQQAVFANGMLVLSHEASNSLEIFDTAKRRVVAQVEGLAGPHGLAVDARGSHLYVANTDGNNITVISTKDWKLERTINLQAAPYNLTLAPDGRHLYAANWRNRSVSIIDLAPSGSITTEDVHGSPHALVFDSTRRILFATMQDTAEVATLDPATLKVQERYKLAASQPTAMVLNSAARRLYVAVRHAVITLDADSGKEIGRVAAPAGVDSLWLDSSAGILFVASGGGYINVFRTAGALTPVEEIRTEVRGYTVAYDPARHFLYLPGGREGRSKLLILKHLPPLTQDEQRAEQVAAR